MPQTNNPELIQSEIKTLALDNTEHLTRPNGKIERLFKNDRTSVLKERDILNNKEWILIDATNVILGRLCAQVAKMLMGKHRPEYTPSLNCGAKIVIINADKVTCTKNKMQDNLRYWHTGYCGGIKQRSWRDILQGPNPTDLISRCVRGMIARSPLGRDRMRNLFIYTGKEHPHLSANPQLLDMHVNNSKNILS